jgi:hypothetical protein
VRVRPGQRMNAALWPDDLFLAGLDHGFTSLYEM